MTATREEAATSLSTTTSNRWRVRASLGEGAANLRDGALLATVLVGIASVVITLALLADVVSAGRVLRAEDAYLAAGGDLLLAQGAQPLGIDAARCDALSDIEGVRAAAAMRVQPAAATLSGRPESQQTVVVATAGVLDILGSPLLPADGVLASQVIADRWEWATGSLLRLEPLDTASVPLPRGMLRVADVADLGLLDEGASTGLLLVGIPAGRADTCFVQIQPQYRADLAAAIPAALGETSTEVINVGDRLPAGASAQDPVAAFDTRITRWAPGAAGAVVGLLWAVVAWTRRGRAALYASIGVPYPGGVLIRWTEGGIVLLVAGLWAAALSASVGIAVLDVRADVVLDIALRGSALATAVALLLIVLAGLWRPATLAALKER